jgi:hypothetical protein
MWLGCGHLKKLGGSSFFKGSRPEFVPGAAGAEGQRGLQKCIIFGERLLQLNLKSLAMEAGHKCSGCPTSPEPILESRAVYILQLRDLYMCASIVGIPNVLLREVGLFLVASELLRLCRVCRDVWERGETIMIAFASNEQARMRIEIVPFQIRLTIPHVVEQWRQFAPIALEIACSISAEAVKRETLRELARRQGVSRPKSQQVW